MAPFLSFQNNVPSRKPQTLAPHTNVGCLWNSWYYFTHDVPVSAFGYFLQRFYYLFANKRSSVACFPQSAVQSCKIQSSHVCQSQGGPSVLWLNKTFSPFLQHHEFWTGGITTPWILRYIQKSNMVDWVTVLNFSLPCHSFRGHGFGVDRADFLASQPWPWPCNVLWPMGQWQMWYRGGKVACIIVLALLHFRLSPEHVSGRYWSKEEERQVE